MGGKGRVLVSGQEVGPSSAKGRVMGITAYVEAVASEEPNASVAWSQAGVVGLELLLVVKASNPEKKLDEKQEGKRKPGPAGHIRVCWLRLWLPNPRTGRVSGPFPPPTSHVSCFLGSLCPKLWHSSSVRSSWQHSMQPECPEQPFERHEIPWWSIWQEREPWC